MYIQYTILDIYIQYTILDIYIQYTIYLGLLGRTQLFSKADGFQDRIGSVLYQALDSINPYRDSYSYQYNQPYQYSSYQNTEDYDYNSQYFS